MAARPEPEPTELRRRVGRRIYAARKAAGFTQTELGHRIAAQLGRPVGFHATAVSYWENAEREPSLDVLVALTDVLRVSLTWLFDINGTDDPYDIAYRKGWDDCAATIRAALDAPAATRPEPTGA